MAGLSEIEWTDATWNPVSGCSMVSPGCTNCYAMRMAARLQAMDHPSYRGTIRKSGGRAVWTGKVVLNKRALNAPLSWRSPKKIFVNSMSDLFQDGVPVEFIGKVWSVMEITPHHTFQILTKRPERMQEVLTSHNFPILANVWLGTSIESGDLVYRIDALRCTPAAIRFVSFEPLLASVGDIELSEMDWAIVGGESGPHARPLRLEWIDEIKASCDRHNVAFFFKQWGGVNKKAAGRTYRGRTWDGYPLAMTS